MEIDFLYKPESTIARVRLNPGESIVAESGAMLGMSTNMTMETGINKTGKDNQSGGKLGALMKGGMRMLSGESFFQNKFTATGGPGEILMTQALPGDIVKTTIPPAGLYLQSSAYIASSEGAEVKGQFGGMKSFLGLGGLFILHATAQAPNDQIIFGSFGGIEEIEIDGTMNVDNGHLVAWEGTVSYTTQKACDGIIASYFSGEGLICKFSGSGKIWIQTRTPTGFGHALSPFLPPL